MEEVREVIAISSLLVLQLTIMLNVISMLAVSYLCNLNWLRLDASVVHFWCGLFATAKRGLLLLLVAQGLLQLTD